MEAEPQQKGLCINGEHKHSPVIIQHRSCQTSSASQPSLTATYWAKRVSLDCRKVTQRTQPSSLLGANVILNATQNQTKQPRQRRHTQTSHKSICQSPPTKSLIACRLANFFEWRDVKVLGTCLFQTGKLRAQITQNGRDIVERYLRFVDKLPHLPHIQHLDSVKRGFLPRQNPLFQTYTETKPWTLQSKLFLTSLLAREAERTTRQTGKVTAGNAVATSCCVKEHRSCSFYVEEYYYGCCK